MAVYNGAPYLREQLNSILSQSYSNWELLVSDDCSDDDSLRILKEYEKRDSRVRVVLEGERYGSAKLHFMALLRLAEASYVMTCDQDDVWDSDKIAVTMEGMLQSEESDQPVLVCTDLRVVDEQLNVISPSFLEYSGMDASKLDFGYFLASCLVTGCTMMINCPLLELLQVPVNAEAIIMHDWWASLVAAAFGKVVHLNRATISYRQHGDNSVGADRFSMGRALAALDQKRATAEKTFSQVEEFKRLYSNFVAPQLLSQINTYLSIMDAKPLARIPLMSKSGIWRHGLLRNAGTLLTFISLGKETD